MVFSTEHHPYKVYIMIEHIHFRCPCCHG
ncbi:hypothetical protein ACNTMI_18060, partial [Klebsiella pneumoniae]